MMKATQAEVVPVSEQDLSPEQPLSIPILVDPEVVQVLRAVHEIDPSATRNSIHDLVEVDQAFAQAVVTEGYRRSHKYDSLLPQHVDHVDMALARQASFIEGAVFATDAIKRTLAIRHALLSDQLSFDVPGMGQPSAEVLDMPMIDVSLDIDDTTPLDGDNPPAAA
jgi:hypothetical protein